MGKTFSLSMLIVGTVIGAGFASGKELCTFFIRFGDGVYGLIVLTCVLFFLAFWLILTVADRIHTGKESGLEAFHHHLYGKFYGIGVLILLTNNMLVTSSMLGAFDVLMPYAPLGSILGGALCLVLLLAGRKGLVGINAVAVPMIVVLLVSVSIYGAFDSAGQLQFTGVIGKGYPQCLLYVGMNALTLGSVLSGTKTTARTRRLAALLSTLMIGILMFVEVLAIRSYDRSVFDAEMPLLKIADTVHLSVIARIVMALGIFTTLAACVHTVAEWLLPLMKVRVLALFAVLTIGFVISRFGFGNIVEVLYPILGVLGLVELSACAVSQGRALWDRRVVVLHKLKYSLKPRIKTRK